MPSLVDVCNRAISKVGGQPITALTDAKTAARAVNRCYEVTRDKLLRENNWNFAIKRAQIATDVATPTWGYDYQYSLPADCIRVISVDGYTGVNEALGQSGTQEPDYAIEGQKILLSDDGPIKIRYVARIDDPNEMDEQFQECWAAYMSVEICEEITQSHTKKQQLIQEYMQLLREAKRGDGIETPGEAIVESDWLNARV